MRIYSFDRSTGRHVDHFGSRFVLSALAESEASGRVSCAHMQTGDTIAEHDALVGQLFCVVDGAGWVSGRDGVRTSISVQQAAHWEPGERHAAGTETGLTAIVIEAGELQVSARRVDDH